MYKTISFFIGPCHIWEFTLVLDVSKSISPRQWLNVKTISKGIIETIGIQKLENRVGLVTFSDFAKKEIFCDDNVTVEYFKRVIEGLEQSGEYGNLEGGLRKGREILNEKGCGKRFDATRKVLILVTDTVALKGNRLKSLYDTTSKIRNDGINIYAIGTGDADLNQLKILTGRADKVFRASDYNDILNGELITSLLSTNCAVNRTHFTSPANVIAMEERRITDLLPLPKANTTSYPSYDDIGNIGLVNTSTTHMLEEKQKHKRRQTKIIFRLGGQIKSIMKRLFQTMQDTSKTKSEIKPSLVASLDNELRYLISILLQTMNQATGTKAKFITMMVRLYLRDIDSLITVILELVEDTTRTKSRMLTDLNVRIKNEAKYIIGSLLTTLNEANIQTAPIIREVVEKLRRRMDLLLTELLETVHKPVTEQEKILRQNLNLVSSGIRSLQKFVSNVRSNFPGNELNVLQDRLSGLVEVIFDTIGGAEISKIKRMRVDVGEIVKSIKKLVNILLSSASSRKKAIFNTLIDETRRLIDKFIKMANDSADIKTNRMISKYIYELGEGLHGIIKELMNAENNSSNGSKLKNIRNAIHELNNNIKNFKQELVDEREEKKKITVPKKLSKAFENGVNTLIEVMLNRMKIKGTRKGKHVITLVSMLNDDVKRLFDALAINMNVSSSTRNRQLIKLTDRITEEVETLTKALLKIAKQIKNVEERDVIKQSIMELNKELAQMVKGLLSTKASSGSKIKSMTKIVAKLNDGVKSLKSKLVRNTNGNGRKLANRVARKINNFVRTLLNRMKFTGARKGKHVITLATMLNDDIKKLIDTLTTVINTSSRTRVRETTTIANKINDKAEILKKALLEIANGIKSFKERRIVVNSIEKLNEELKKMVGELLDTMKHYPQDSMIKQVTKVMNRLDNEVKDLTNTLAIGNGRRNAKLVDRLQNEINNLIKAVVGHMKLPKDTERHVLSLVDRLNNELRNLINGLIEKGNADGETRRNNIETMVPRVNREIEGLTEALLKIAKKTRDKGDRILLIRVVDKLYDELEKMLHSLLGSIEESPAKTMDHITKIIDDLGNEIKTLANAIVATTDGAREGRTKQILKEIHGELESWLKELLRTMKVKRTADTKAIVTEIVQRLNEQIKKLVEELLKTTDKKKRSRHRLIAGLVGCLKDEIKTLEKALMSIAGSSSGRNSRVVKNIVYRLNEELEQLLQSLSQTINEPTRTKVNSIIKSINKINDKIKELNQEMSQKNTRNSKVQDTARTFSDEREYSKTGPTEYTSLVRIYLSSSKKTTNAMVSLLLCVVWTYFFFIMLER